MKEIQLNTVIQVFEQIEELAPIDQKLMKAAQEVLVNAHAPYSNFRVGAAVLLKNGVIISGGNVENAAYPMCLCAERVALASAQVQYPDQAVLRIAITVKGPKSLNKPAAPCGACRQVICETENRHQQDIAVLLRADTGPIYALASGKDLLPLSFDASFL